MESKKTHVEDRGRSVVGEDEDRESEKKTE